jgi:hypothetical protein
MTGRTSKRTDIGKSQVPPNKDYIKHQSYCVCVRKYKQPTFSRRISAYANCLCVCKQVQAADLQPRLIAFVYVCKQVKAADYQPKLIACVCVCVFVREQVQAADFQPKQIAYHTLTYEG